MATSFSLIQQALDEQLQTVTSLPTFVRENKKFVDKNTSFCRSTLLLSQPTVLTLGSSPTVRNQMTYQVDLFTLVGSGFETPRAIQDDVLAAFPANTSITTVDGVRLDILVSYPVTGAVHDSKYYSSPVQVVIAAYYNQ